MLLNLNPPVRRWGMRTVSLAVFVVVGFVGSVAEARIYKYTKPDGTVVYTDRLSQLPSERRAYYNRLEKEERKKEEAAKSRMSKEERERAEYEAERKRIAEAQMSEAERRRRLAAIDEAIASLQARNAKRDELKKEWQRRQSELQESLDKKLAEFRRTKEEWSALAIQADYALFPGQAQRKQELYAKLSKLESEIDGLLHQLTVVLPEEARRAGIPPGWLRN